MRHSKKSIFELTNSGLDIYSHVISQYDNGPYNLEANGNMTYPNPFNNMEKTLQISVSENGIAYHSDTTGAIAHGDAIDFASLHYKLCDEDLIEVLYSELGLDTNTELVSFFEAPISNVKPSMSITLKEVLELIKSDIYKSRTFKLRAIEEANQAKEYKASNFDYVTFSGVFTSRSNNALQSTSGLLVIDLDNLPNLEDVREDLLGDDNIQTALLFTSPSGNGLKWVVYVDLCVCSHQEWFNAIANYLLEDYGLEVDRSGKDVSRACFLSHDDMAFYQPKDQARMKFDPLAWLPNPSIGKESTSHVVSASAVSKSMSKYEVVDALISKVEEHRIDLTASYADWVNIGFALSDEFGESGRDFFRRLSRFYSGYNESECDKQYDNCLRGKGVGITIGTLFYLAKKSSILVTHKEEVEADPVDNGLPHFSEEVLGKLPDFFKRAIAPAANNQERDLLLLGSLIVVSACLSNVVGKYDRRSYHPNLYLFVVGKASAGKGILNHCKYIVNPIHDELRNISAAAMEKYDAELLEYNRKKKAERGKAPSRPADRRLYIPANTSSSGAYQLISENQGNGLIFETEGDTLSQAFKADYGNYSDGLRKAYHHETISYYRKTDREEIEIKRPRISALLSGTPKQVSNLIDSPENGLFSRFMFYYLESNLEWIDVFAEHEGIDIIDQFKLLGELFYGYHSDIDQLGEITFSLQKHQEEAFNQYFDKVQFKYHNLLGEDFVASIRRLGVMAFRIAMIFKVIRSAEKNEKQSTLICIDDDFDAAMGMVDVLFKHASYVFTAMFDNKPLNLKERFLDELPDEFNRDMYLAVGAQLGIKQKTADAYINRFAKNGLINRYAHNQYVKR